MVRRSEGGEKASRKETSEKLGTRTVALCVFVLILFIYELFHGAIH